MVVPSPRRWLPALIAVGLLTATGCSPAPEPTVGLQRDGDGFAVLTPLCPGGEVLSVSVKATGGDLRGAEWEITPDPGGDRSTDRFPLFRTPPGWTAGVTEITALTAGQTYTAYPTTTLPKSSFVDFTLADLEKLEGDEVLTYREGGGATRVKAAKFRARALKSC
ncbi:hypothetical protein ABZW03_07365 [Kitasatospora sp. NPDC004799]|uniref:hypothetical protein n=1 Tax=Kitasatospora sp. NPDC004799 TaxID=3154460 RepID=UPI00339E78E1